MEIEGYHMPNDLHYEENHYWVKKDGDALIMGMDDFAQKMAGEIVYVQLPAEGKKLIVAKCLTDAIPKIFASPQYQHFHF